MKTKLTIKLSESFSKSLAVLPDKIVGRMLKDIISDKELSHFVINKDYKIIYPSKKDKLNINKPYSLELLQLNDRCSNYFNKKYINNKSLECFSKLIEKGYSIIDIKKAILNAKSSPFWIKNFISPCKLISTNQYGELYIDVFLALSDTPTQACKPKEHVKLNIVKDDR